MDLGTLLAPFADSKVWDNIYVAFCCKNPSAGGAGLRQASQDWLTDVCLFFFPLIYPGCCFSMSPVLFLRKEGENYLNMSCLLPSWLRSKNSSCCYFMPHHETVLGLPLAMLSPIALWAHRALWACPTNFILAFAKRALCNSVVSKTVEVVRGQSQSPREMHGMPMHKQ